MSGGFAQSDGQAAPSTDSDWLSTHLAHHPIFSLPASNPSSQAYDAQSTSIPELASGSRQKLLQIKGTDLLLAINKSEDEGEIRIASILEAKKAYSQKGSSISTASYKVFSPSIPFAITSITTNQTGKLIAVAGVSQLIVCISPRSGWMSHPSRTVSVKTIPIGKYYHNKGSARIAKVDWHPWAQGGASLLVLTEDGVLREYDLSNEHSDPAQTLSFLPGRAAQSLTNLSSSTSHKRHRSFRSASASHEPFTSPLNGGSSSSKRRKRDGTPGLAEHMTRLGLDDESSAETAVSFTFGAGLLQPAQSPARPTNSGLSVGTESQSGNEDAQGAHESAGWNGWAPLELYAIMKNGDIYKVCPFLPSKAMIPPTYLRHLTSYVNLQAEQAAASGGTRLRQLDLAIRYVRSLAQQAASPQNRRSQRAGTLGLLDEEMLDEQGTPARDLEGRRRRSTTAKLSPIAARSKSMMSIDTPATAGRPSVAMDDPLTDVLAGLTDLPVFVEAPKLPMLPSPQAVGPHLLRPAPIELSDRREPSASDILISRVSLHESGSSSDAHREALTVVVVAMDDGRVDVCLAISGSQAMWDETLREKEQTISSRAVKLRTQRAGSKAGRFTLSDSDETEEEGEEDETDETLEAEGPERQQAESLPTLLVYESIDLSTGLGSPEEVLSLPSFVLDPIYSDTIYVYHSAGAYALSFRPWSSRLGRLFVKATENGGGAQNELGRFLREQVHSDVVQIIKASEANTQGRQAQAVTGFGIITDVYLSYALLAVTADLQPIGMELDFRIDDEIASFSNEKSTAVDSDSEGKKGYASLLAESGAFEIPEPLKSYRGLPSQPRITGQSKFGKGEVIVTPDSLRFLGKTTEKLREEVRAITRAGSACQMRLDLQLKELVRQVSRLSDLKTRADAGCTRGSQISTRFDSVESKQTALNKRIDALLQKLVVLHQPEISIYERKWFDELARLSAEFGVKVPGDEKTAPLRPGSVMMKIVELSAKLDLLRPELKEQRERQLLKEAEAQSFGTSQLIRISRALSQQSALLLEAKQKAQELSVKAGQRQIV